MNILVTNISTLPVKKDNEGKTVKADQRTYSVSLQDYDKTEIKAIHTNESILKCISHIKSVKEAGGINRIIALVSDAVKNKISEPYEMTAYDYYCEKVRECFGNIEIKPIEYEISKDNPKRTALVFDEVCSYINNDDVVYIDSAGGARTTSSLIQLLAKLLRYKGIENSYNLYANIQGSKAFIEDTREFQEMTDIADALNEFMTTGKSEQLNNLFKGENIPSEYSDLLKNMNEFSDKIRLGIVDDLDSTVESLKSNLKKCKELQSDETYEIGTVILKQFLETIENKLIGNMQEGPDYLKITKWCIENGLIQQALTIFNEKMPRYIFMKKYISVTPDEKKEANSNNNGFDWEYTAFWDHLLTYDKDNPLVAEFKNCIKKGKKTQNSLIKEKVNYLRQLSFPIESYKIDPKYPTLIQLAKNRYCTKEKFINTVCNNETAIRELIEIEITTKDITTKREANFNSKFTGIKKLMECTIPTSGFRFNLKKDRIIKMLYGFAYVKALRNKINHASSEEILSEENQKCLSKYDLKYGFKKDDSLEDIRNSLNVAVRYFEPESLNDQKETDETNDTPKFYSTNLKVGDVVLATCVDKKIVRLDGYDYDIQLVIPQFEDPIQYINTEMKVEILQISKLQKICQVKFIEKCRC